MNTWWFKNRIRKLKLFIEYLKIIPDLKTRITIIVVMICFIISSFFLGLIIGKNIEASRSISITGAISHVPYDENILATVSGGKGALFANNDEEKNYVASLGGKVYYYKTCKGYSRIKEENRVWFISASVAKASGYSPAKNCTMPK